MSYLTCTINVTNVSGLSTYAFTLSNIHLYSPYTKIYLFYPGTNTWIDYSDGGSSSYTFLASSNYYALMFSNDTMTDMFPALMKSSNNTLTYIANGRSYDWTTITLPTANRSISLSTDNFPLQVQNSSSSNVDIQVSYNNITRTYSPGTSDLLSYNGNATFFTMTATAPSYTVTAQNTQNMKQIQVGSTVYNSFPASIPITGNTTLQCSGEDDKTITVNYTNTSVPVITDTQ